MLPVVSQLWLYMMCELQLATLNFNYVNVSRLRYFVKEDISI